jgi:hypothetical protein
MPNMTLELNALTTVVSLSRQEYVQDFGATTPSPSSRQFAFHYSG